MPVILAPENYARWLGEESAEPVQLLGMLKPFPVVKNDDAAVIEPLAAA